MGLMPVATQTNDVETRVAASSGHPCQDTELGRVLQTIQQLQTLSFSSDDAAERMQQVEAVQDELIKQLDELHHLVQQQIDRLSQNRHVEPLAATSTEAV